MDATFFTLYVMFLILLVNDVAAQTLTNVTIDDTSPMIAYAGNWEKGANHLSVMNMGGSHKVSSDPNSFAIFTFTGVAVYYLAPKWPYAVDSYVSVDGGAPVLVDMTGPLQNSATGEETILSDVLWSATGLGNVEHLIVVTRGAHFNIVDGFIYTTQSGSSSNVRPTTTGTQSSSSSTPTSTESPTPSQSSSRVILAVAVSASIVSLILIIGFAVFFVRRNKERNHQWTGSDSGAGAGGGTYARF